MRTSFRSAAAQVILWCSFIGSTATGAAQDLSQIRDYSVIVRNQFSTNSDVVGRTITGGDLNVGSSNFATGLVGQIATSEYSVRVGGSLLGQNPIQIQAGSLEIGGSTNGRQINFNGGGLVVNAGDNYTDLHSKLVVASSKLQLYSANSTYTKPGAQPGAFVFNATPDANGLAVFHVAEGDLFGNSQVQQIDLIANGATDFVFNIEGASVNFNDGNLTGLFVDYNYLQKMVWNFADATSVNFNAKSVGGLILAPQAVVTLGTQINGTIVAENINATAKINSPYYTGVFTTPSSPLLVQVPEPSLPLLAGMGMAALLRRRQK